MVFVQRLGVVLLSCLGGGCGASIPSPEAPVETDASSPEESNLESPNASETSPASSDAKDLVSEEIGIPAPFAGLKWEMTQEEAAALGGTEDGELFTSAAFPDRLFFVEYEKSSEKVLRLWFEAQDDDVEAAMNLWNPLLVSPANGKEVTYFFDYDTKTRARLVVQGDGPGKIYIERFTPVSDLLGSTGFEFLGVPSLDQLTLDGLKKSWSADAEIKGKPGREEVSRRLSRTEYELEPVRAEVQFRDGTWRNVSVLFAQTGSEFGGELKKALTKRWGQASTSENPSDDTLSIRFSNQPQALVTILPDGDVLLELMND